VNGRLLVIGDALLDRDIEGRAERTSRPGGAGLAAALAARNGRPVTLLTALASDRAGKKLARLLLNAGVDLIDLGLPGRTPERVRLLRSGRPLLSLDRGDPPANVSGIGAVVTLRVALSEADGVLVSDCGRGVASDDHIRTALAARSEALPLAWDPHPHGTQPLASATLATPSLAEAVSCADGVQPEDERQLGELASGLARRWEVEQVAITLGRDGALLAPEGRRHWHVRCARASGDSRGAGDMFAAEVASRLADSRSGKDAVTSAVAAATRFVSDGYVREDRLRLLGRPRRARRPSGGSPSPSLARALELAERVRKHGGTISATDGRFDALRLDHVRCLEAAARLGDRLIVLLTSDRAAGAAALRDLACVGEVAIFDGPSPLESLRLLRPEVWAKGDHDIDRLSEHREVPSWGGRVAILPQALGCPTRESLCLSG
jgi:bifunctional ADP-heptose synthase (sugar kinase/adenylyltransferase)